MRVFVEGIGIIGPGLDGWQAARLVLSDAETYEPAPVRPPQVGLLPPAERRRAVMTVRLAIATGIEAITQAGCDPAEMAMVFTASGGDGEKIHETLAVLATQQREVSPTRFHNSVHNAPSGYWSLATGSRTPSTSLSAYDASFSAGLLEAAVQVTTEACPVTLIAYDVPYPEPLHTARPITATFGVALVLTPGSRERTIAELSISLGDTVSSDTGMGDPALERLRLGNPAARVLPLLTTIARGRPDTVHLDGIGIAVTLP